VRLSLQGDLNEARERVLAHCGVILPDNELLQMICDGTLPGEPEKAPSPPEAEPEAEPATKSGKQIMHEMKALFGALWQDGYDAGYEARDQETTYEDYGQ
jgi:hypothetical protein